MTVFRILENSQKITGGGVLFQKRCSSSFCILLKQDRNMSVFLRMFQNFKKNFFLKHLWIAVSEFTGSSHSSFSLFPLYVYGNIRLLKISFSIIICDGHVVRYGFVGLLNNQSILMRMKLFLITLYIRLFIYYTQYTAFN